jgi:hypothetical protein
MGFNALGVVDNPNTIDPRCDPIHGSAPALRFLPPEALTTQLVGGSFKEENANAANFRQQNLEGKLDGVLGDVVSEIKVILPSSQIPPECLDNIKTALLQLNGAVIYPYINYASIGDMLGFSINLHDPEVYKECGPRAGDVCFVGNLIAYALRTAGKDLSIQNYSPHRTNVPPYYQELFDQMDINVNNLNISDQDKADIRVWIQELRANNGMAFYSSRPGKMEQDMWLSNEGDSILMFRASYKEEGGKVIMTVEIIRLPTESQPWIGEVDSNLLRIYLDDNMRQDFINHILGREPATTHPADLALLRREEQQRTID